MIYLSAIRAAIEIERSNPARAIELLRPALPYEATGRMLQTHVRGQAYLRMGAGKEAAAEFQKLLNNRAWEPLNPMYALAHLGLGRAQSLAGDTARSRKAYEDLFELWKDADQDVPVLKQARKEYARLPRN